MAPLPSRTPRPGAVLLAALGLLGCTEQSTIPNGVVHPTLVEVSPSDFMQGVPCLDATGAMRSYVATVWDIGPPPLEGEDEDVGPQGDAGAGGAGGADGAGEDTSDASAKPSFEPFALPSSGPVKCDQPVSFARVVDGHRYRAEIEGYDRPGLAPLDDRTGVPVLVDPATGERVLPRWKSSCGGKDGTIARFERTRNIVDCTPLVDSMPSELTAVEVRIDGVLGSLQCGEEPGQVSHFEVERAPGDIVSEPCGSSVVFEDVSAGMTVRLPVYAYEAGATTPSWGTTCTAVAATGTVVPASCTTLTDRGGIDVAPEDALAAYGIDCEGLGLLTLTWTPTETDPPDPDAAPASGDVRYVTSANCAKTVRFTGIPRGPTSVRASATDASGAALGIADCSGEIVPNQAVPAVCALEP